MAKKAYVAVDGVARKVTKIYTSVDGVARRVTKGYVGVDGVARQWWAGGANLLWEQVGYHYGAAGTTFTVEDTGSSLSALITCPYDETSSGVTNAAGLAARLSGFNPGDEVSLTCEYKSNGYSYIADTGDVSYDSTNSSWTANSYHKRFTSSGTETITFTAAEDSIDVLVSGKGAKDGSEWYIQITNITVNGEQVYPA